MSKSSGKKADRPAPKPVDPYKDILAQFGAHGAEGKAALHAVEALRKKYPRAVLAGHVKSQQFRFAIIDNSTNKVLAKFKKPISLAEDTPAVELSRLQPLIEMFRPHVRIGDMSTDRYALSHAGPGPEGAAAIKAAMALRKKYPNAVLVGDLGSGHTRFAIIDRVTGDTLAKCKKHTHIAEGTKKGYRRPKPENVQSLKEELTRLRPLIDAFGANVRLVGTSEFRFMQKTIGGRAQIADLEQAAGHSIYVLSGRQEAKYNRDTIRDAFPEILLHHDPKASGKVIAFAALGGGSLQMGEFDNGFTKKLVSIPHGIDTLDAETDHDVSKVKDKLVAALDGKTKFEKIDTLYVAGGGWRDLGAVISAARHAATKDAPKSPTITMSFHEAKSEILAVSQMSHATYKKLEASERSLHEIKIAAQALLAVMEKFQVENVVICNATMRQAVARDEHFPATAPAAAPPPAKPRQPYVEPITPAPHALAQAQGRRKAETANRP